MMPPAETVADEFVRFYGPEAWTDWLRLQAHFDLGEGFAFLILLLPGAIGAEICRRQLKQHLAAKGRLLVELPCEWPDDARHLPERIFAVEPADNLGGIWLGTVIPETDPEIQNWRKAWRQGLASLNMQRNPLRERVACPLVLVGAPWLHILLRETAPDLWSVRTGVVSVTPALEPTQAGTKDYSLIEPATLPVMSGEAAADPDYVLEQAERLKDRPGLETARAQLLLRAGNGFYEHARFPSAEKCFRQAADLFAVSAAKNSDIQADLAGTLNNLANTLTVLGRREEALAQAQAAERIYAQLAQARPEAFLPNLATTLINLANKLSAVGRREEALAQAQEAVRIYSQLAQARSDAILPDLAASLNNLAVILSDLGRREEALAQAQEAVRIRAQLAQVRPEAFLPNWATSCGARGSILTGLGRHTEAADSFAQGMRALTPLFQKTPGAFADLMGQLYHSYQQAIQQAKTEPDQALLAPVQEVFERLNKPNPGSKGGIRPGQK